MRYVHNASPQRIAHILRSFAIFKWKSGGYRRKEAVLEAFARSAALTSETIKQLIEDLSLENDVIHFGEIQRNRFLTPLLKSFTAFLGVDDQYAIGKLHAWHLFCINEISGARIRISLLANVASRSKLTPAAGELLLSWLYEKESSTSTKGGHMRQLREAFASTICLIDVNNSNAAAERRVFAAYVAGDRHGDDLEKFYRTLTIWKHRLEIGSTDAEEYFWSAFMTLNDISVLKALESFVIKPLSNSKHGSCFLQLLAILPSTFNNSECHVGRCQIVARCLIPYACDQKHSEEIYKYLTTHILERDTLQESERLLLHHCASVLRTGEDPDSRMETLEGPAEVSGARIDTMAAGTVKAVLEGPALPGKELRVFARRAAESARNLPIDLIDRSVIYLLTAYFRSGWQNPPCIEAIKQLMHSMSYKCANQLTLLLIEMLPRVSIDSRSSLLWELVRGCCSLHELEETSVAAILKAADDTLCRSRFQWRTTMISMYRVILILTRAQTPVLDEWLRRFLEQHVQLPTEHLGTADWEGIARILNSAKWLSGEALWKHVIWVLDNAQTGSRNRNKKLESILPPILYRSLHCKQAALDLIDKLPTYHEDIQALLIRTAKRIGTDDIYGTVKSIRDELQPKALHEYDIWARQKRH